MTSLPSASKWSAEKHMVWGVRFGLGMWLRKKVATFFFTFFPFLFRFLRRGGLPVFCSGNGKGCVGLVSP